MGSFAYSMHVKTDDHAAVVEIVKGELADFGFVPTDEAPAPDSAWEVDNRLRALRVSTSRDGWVSLLDSDMISMMSLAVALSARLGTYALLVLVNDSDSWHYQIYHQGRKVDEFSSVDDSDDMDDIEQDFWNDDEMQEAFEEEFEKLPEAAQEQLNELGEQIQAMMPPEIVAIHQRLENGQVDPDEAQRYTQWFQSQLPQLMQGFGALAETLGGAPGGLPGGNGDDDQDFGFLDGDEPPRGALSAALDGADDDFEAADPRDPVQLAAHAESLKGLLKSGVERERVSEVLGREDVFAEQTLAAFLPLLGIEPFYATLNYGYFDACSDDELSAVKIAIADHLKFAAAES